MLRSGATGNSSVCPRTTPVPVQVGGRGSAPSPGSPVLLPESEQAISSRPPPFGGRELGQEPFGVPPVKLTVTSTVPNGTSSTVPKSTMPEGADGTLVVWVTLVTYPSASTPRNPGPAIAEKLITPSVCPPEEAFATNGPRHVRSRRSEQNFSVAFTGAPVTLSTTVTVELIPPSSSTVPTFTTAQGAGEAKVAFATNWGPDPGGRLAPRSQSGRPRARRCRWTATASGPAPRAPRPGIRY